MLSNRLYCSIFFRFKPNGRAFSKMADNVINTVEGYEWKNFIFRMVRPEYHPEIFEHMRNNFYVDEPLNVLTGYSEEKAQDMDVMITTFFKDDLSFVVIDKDTNKIVGARITASHSRNEAPDGFQMKSPEMQTILPFLNQVDAEAKIFEKFPHCDKYAELFMASVDKTYRGQGIASEMYNVTLPFLRGRGYKLVKSTFTSPYTQRISQKLGFKELARAYFNQYKDSSGQVRFPNAKDDECAVVGVLEL